MLKEENNKKNKELQNLKETNNILKTESQIICSRDLIKGINDFFYFLFKDSPTNKSYNEKKI